MLNPMSPIYSAVIALVAQLCPTLWDTMDCGPPGSSVHGISQARILEWVAITFRRECSQPKNGSRFSCIADGLSIAEPPGKLIRPLTLL